MIHSFVSNFVHLVCRIMMFGLVLCTVDTLDYDILIGNVSFSFNNIIVSKIDITIYKTSNRLNDTK